MRLEIDILSVKSVTVDERTGGADLFIGVSGLVLFEESCHHLYYL